MITVKKERNYLAGDTQTSLYSGGSCQIKKSSIELHLEKFCPECGGANLSDKYEEYLKKDYLDYHKLDRNQKRQVEVLKGFIPEMANKEKELCQDAYSVYHGGSSNLLFLYDLNSLYQEFTTGETEHNLVRIVPNDYVSIFDYMNLPDVQSKLRSAYSQFFDGRGVASDLMSVSLSILDSRPTESAADFFIKQNNEALDINLTKDIVTKNLKAIGIQDVSKYHELLEKYISTVDSCMIQFFFKKNEVRNFLYLSIAFGKPFNVNFSNNLNGVNYRYTQEIIERYKWDPLNFHEYVGLKFPGISSFFNNNNVQGRIIITSPELYKRKALQYFIYFDPEKEKAIETLRAEFRALLSRDLSQIRAVKAAQQVFVERDWPLTIATEVYKYFGKAYTNELTQGNREVTRVIGGKIYTVLRPNHALAHGMRRSYLAGDLIQALNAMDSTNLQISRQAKTLINWVKDKLRNDKYFAQKIAMIAAFPRTGRQNEGDRALNVKLYDEFLKKDAENFTRFAQKYIGEDNLFKSEAELDTVARVLKTYDIERLADDPDAYNLGFILKVAHSLDLRRLPSKSKEYACKTLFGERVASDLVANKVCEDLWARSGRYLEATGDKDRDTDSRTGIDIRAEYGDKFFLISNSPEAVVEALNSVR